VPVRRRRVRSDGQGRGMATRADAPPLPPAPSPPSARLTSVEILPRLRQLWSQLPEPPEPHLARSGQWTKRLAIYRTRPTQPTACRYYLVAIPPLSRASNRRRRRALALQTFFANGPCPNSAGNHWKPEVLHAMNWHTGMFPALDAPDPEISTVFTDPQPANTRGLRWKAERMTWCPW